MDINTVVSLVIPLEQDGDILEQMLRDVDAMLSKHYRFYEIILIDDGSTDQTPVLVQKLLKQVQNVRYLRLSRPFGREIALSAGIESAIGDYVVTLDPHDDPVDKIPEMIALCRRSGGVVHGMAVNVKPRSWFRETLGQLFRAYFNKRMGIEMRRGVNDFRVMSRQAVNALLQIKEQNRYLRVLTMSLGYAHDFFSYDRSPRTDAIKTQRWRHDAMTAISLLTANTRHPLRVVTLAGVLGGLLNMVYALYVLTVFLLKPNVTEGWTTISLQLSCMFLFICVILAVLSEYVGTILGEVKGRPLYFIAQESNSSVLLEDTVQSSIVKESKPE